MKIYPKCLFFVLTVLSTHPLLAQSSLDVLSYHLHLEPNFAKHVIKGDVTIKFKSDVQKDKITLDCGNLQVIKIDGEGVESFEQKSSKLTVLLRGDLSQEHEIQIHYKGSPERGMIFQDSPPQLYTIYFTSDWMVCNSSPDDRATLKMDILIADSLTSVASGEFLSVEKQQDGKKSLHRWEQMYESPSYTFGMAIGSFRKSHENHGGINLNYFTSRYSQKEMEVIFEKTRHMMDFFEDKSGIPYPQKSYSQVLMGHHYQEMSGFAVLKQQYGNLVLKDSTETNLISHELAHQWWGNRITCKSWNHMWLNEGMATFMSAAYNEHRFGSNKYMSDIGSYQKVYETIRKRGGDKPLVFRHWINPSPDDRNLVYFKGAYVMHLLRVELGDEEFWKGIKYFTKRFYDKSVVTNDFQKAMEESSQKNLGEFFDQWIYSK